jgi:Nif-specific regulatory protein
MTTDIYNKKLSVLYKFSCLMGEALNLDKTLNEMLKILSEALSMKRATLTLKKGLAGPLVIHASHGLSALEMERGVYKQGEGITGRIFKNAQPYVVPDISQEPHFLNKTGSRKFEKGRNAFLGVPILLGGDAIGVLNVDRLFSDEVSFEEDIEFLTIVAALISQLVSLNQEVDAREEMLLRTNRSLKAEISEKYHHFFMVGASPAMREVQQLISKVSGSKASVLLLGESGTGKTLVARILHEMSPRAQNPFVKLNCAALPENLLESELFGYERGAFSGADKSKPGRVESANGGTLFLDEIGELPLLLQTKLLRFVQEREFERLGSNQTRKVDVRVVTATNLNLTKAVATGAFREDLFYRLNVFPINVPALQQRGEDIPLLLQHFMKHFGAEYNKHLKLTDSALKALMSYRWPGNVREMENLVERLAILTESGKIDAEDLPPHIFNEAPKKIKPKMSVAPPRACSLEEVEKEAILAALESNEWVQSRAAKELGLTVRQLGYRIKKLELKKSVFFGKNGTPDARPSMM